MPGRGSYLTHDTSMSRRNGSHRKLYSVWKSMLYRCYNPHSQGYHNYGGRGIYVCEEWKNDLESFAAWARAQHYNHTLSIDRIDNDGPYSPENCRFTDRKTQSLNRRDNVFIEAFGETKTVSQWAEDPRCTVGHGALKSRLRSGWIPERAIAEPYTESGLRAKEARLRRAIEAEDAAPAIVYRTRKITSAMAQEHHPATEIQNEGCCFPQLPNPLC